MELNIEQDISKKTLPCVCFEFWQLFNCIILIISLQKKPNMLKRSWFSSLNAPGKTKDFKVARCHLFFVLQGGEAMC